MLSLRRTQDASPDLRLRQGELPTDVKTWNQATQASWLDAVCSATQKNRTGLGAHQDRGGLGLQFIGLRIDRPLEIPAFDATNATQVLRGAQLLHSRASIAATHYRSALLRDVDAFLGAANCPKLDSRTERGQALLAKLTKPIVELQHAHRGDTQRVAAAVEKANTKLAAYGVQLEATSAFVYAKPILDDVPPELIKLVQAHRQDTLPRLEGSPTSAADRAERIGTILAAAGERNLTIDVDHAKGRLELHEPDGTKAGFLDFHATKNGETVRLGGYGGGTYGWEKSGLEGILHAKLLALHPNVKVIEKDLMEDTADFAAYRAIAGGSLVKPNVDNDAAVQTPIGQDLAMFNNVRAEVTDTGYVPGTKIIRAEPSYATVRFHLS